jgi:hypothetical protein
MSSKDPVPGDKGKRGRAVKRLLAAIEESRRARDAGELASDTQSDIAARTSLRTADDQVVARERSLKAIDDHYY